MPNFEPKILKTKHETFDLALGRVETFKNDPCLESVNLVRYDVDWYLEITIYSKGGEPNDKGEG